jgi:glycosyltransferase involved in cell wall biosynthesis
MHIGFVENGYPLDGRGGGAGTFVEIFAGELISAGHQVTVVAPRSDELPVEGDISGLTVVRPGMGGTLHYHLSRIPLLRFFRHAVRYLEYGRAVARVVNGIHARHPFDLVEYSEGGDFWHAGSRNFKTVSHLHGSRYTFLKESGRSVTPADWLQRRLELRFIKAADWVFSPANSTLRTVSREAAVGIENASVLPYPIDPQQWSGSAPSEKQAEPPVRIMFAARNDPVKGADLLLDAAAELAASGRAVQFELFGFRANPNQNLPACVVVNPFMPKRELLDQYPRVDICVVPSFWDNSPNTVYEAMAAGKPVVASAVGGIPEIVESGVTGLLVEPKSKELLVDALVSLIDSPALRRSMGLAGWERIRALGNPTTNCWNRMRKYEDLVG